MPIQRLTSDEALLQELGQRIARLCLERNLSQAQLAEQAGISKRTLERLELLLCEPQPSPLALLEQQQATRQRASRRLLAKPASSWTWGQP